MAGTYTDIVEIVAPSEASVGGRVDVTVKIKNIDTIYWHLVACVAVVNGLRFIDEAVVIPSGETYLYSGAFLMGGGDVTIHAYSYYPYYEEWILDDEKTKDIKLSELPASDIADFDFRAQGGTYNLGQSVPYTAPYKYKGKAQGGYLTISLGTGVYPSFFTKHTFAKIRVTFAEAVAWKSDSLSGSFTLPTTLEPGQTYSTRAKLETDDGAQETDTDWTVFSITEAAVPEFSQFEITNYSRR